MPNELIKPTTGSITTTSSGPLLPAIIAQAGDNAARRSISGQSAESKGWAFLDRHVVRSSLGGCNTALVVDLGGRDVPVAEKFLDLPDIDSGSQEQSRRRSTERVRRVWAGCRWIGLTFLGPNVSWESLQVGHDEAVHRRWVEGRIGELMAARVLAGPKERPVY